MKPTISIFVCLMFLMFTGCATLGGGQEADIMQQIQDVSDQSYQAKLDLGDNIIKNWRFDGPFWRAFLDGQGNLRVSTTKSMDALDEISLLADDDITVGDRGAATAYWLIIVRDLVRVGIEDLLPQFLQLLSLF